MLISWPGCSVGDCGLRGSSHDSLLLMLMKRVLRWDWPWRIWRRANSGNVEGFKGSSIGIAVCGDPLHIGSDTELIRPDEFVKPISDTVSGCCEVCRRIGA